MLEVLLPQEALLSTMEMMMHIQKAVEKSKPPADIQPSARPRRQSVVSSVVSSTVSSTVKKIGPRRGLTCVLWETAEVDRFSQIILVHNGTMSS